MDYEQFDKALDQIEPHLHRLVAEQGLKGAQIERWRWDEPAITLTWRDQHEPLIWRNIRLFLEGGATPSTVVLEINAWIDEDQTEKGLRRRRWDYYLFPQEPVETVDYSRIVKSAYEKHKEWREKESLRKTAEITPF